MSDTDPYAAPVTQEARKIDPTPAVEAAVEAPEAPVTEEMVVPEGSIKKVLDWVSDDAAKAKAALDAENAGEKRSTLIAKLESIID